MLSNITINEHSSIRIDGNHIIYFDPYRITNETHDADIIFITHAHYDHFSPEDIVKLQKETTLFVMPQSMKGEEEKLLKSKSRVLWLSPNDITSVFGYPVQSRHTIPISLCIPKKTDGWVMW